MINDPRLAGGREPRASPAHPPRPPPAPGTIVFVLSGPIARTDVDRLCERVRVLLEGSDADLILCDVGALFDPDCITIDVLARLQLTALRAGRRVQLLDACGELRDLLTFAGLSETVPAREDLSLQPGGQAEEGEPAGGVQEERDAADPIA